MQLLIRLAAFALLLVPVGVFAADGRRNAIDVSEELGYPDVYVSIDEPEQFLKGVPTQIIFYALPNGNTIPWTAGKKMEDGDDWHFNIQHIAAQTEFLRSQNGKKCNYVTVYLMAKQKAWSSWHRLHSDISASVYYGIISDIIERYAQYNPRVTLSSHSGGGYFLFNYLESVEKPHPAIVRLAFLDSVYGYETQRHLSKLTRWLKSPLHSLAVISYEDVTVVYNGKPLVSASGGTWGRSHKMIEDLQGSFKLRMMTDSTMVSCRSANGRISFKMVLNPQGKIYHTVLVEKNGFIDSVLSGTAGEGKNYTFWGERAYEPFIR